MADEDLDFGAKLNDLRRARRTAARKLRAEGLPVRDIASRLGTTHPTILADLRESGPTLLDAARADKTRRNAAVVARLTGQTAEDPRD